MKRPILIELALDGLVVAGTVWLVFAWPFEPAPRPAPGTDSDAPAVRELRSPEGEPGSMGSGQRALAVSQQPSAKQAALNEADEPVSVTPNSDAPLLVVTASRLNMRSQPNAGASTVGSYPRGELVEQLDRRGNWVLVKVLDDQTTGWMYTDYLGEAAEN